MFNRNRIEILEAEMAGLKQDRHYMLAKFEALNSDLETLAAEANLKFENCSGRRLVKLDKVRIS